MDQSISKVFTKEQIIGKVLTDHFSDEFFRDQELIMKHQGLNVLINQPCNRTVLKLIHHSRNEMDGYKGPSNPLVDEAEDKLD